MKHTIRYILSLLALYWLLTSTLYAADFPEQAEIYLIASDNSETRIGSIKFSTINEKQVDISVDMDNAVFSEHFLSMRPFRCLQGVKEWFCYLEYPYELKNVISVNDLSDLEYQLLFIKKTSSEFGINAWNGLYYKLTIQDNGEITGTLFEGDLNTLQSPPLNRYDKPVDLMEFIEADTEKRLYPKLVIR